MPDSSKNPRFSYDWSWCSEFYRQRVFWKYYNFEGIEYSGSSDSVAEAHEAAAAFSGEEVNQ